MGAWFATRCTHSRPRSFFTQLHFYPFKHLSNCCSCKLPENWIRHSLRLNLCLDKNSGSCSRLWTARSQPPTLRSARKPSIHRSPAVMARCRHAAPSASSMAADRNRNRSDDSRSNRRLRNLTGRRLGACLAVRRHRVMPESCQRYVLMCTRTEPHRVYTRTDKAPHRAPGRAEPGAPSAARVLSCWVRRAGSTRQSVQARHDGRLVDSPPCRRGAVAKWRAGDGDW